MSVISLNKRCQKCDARLHRMNGKWWCLICKKFVRPKK
jgi:uncharacterized Zn finger protein (UPF0148 family)